MINTIEIAPAVLAASLAKHITKSFYLFETLQGATQHEPLSEQDLRELIRDFLTKDNLP